MKKEDVFEPTQPLPAPIPELQWETGIPEAATPIPGWVKPKVTKVKIDTVKQLLQKLRIKYTSINNKEPDKYTWQILKALGDIFVMEEKRDALKKK